MAELRRQTTASTRVFGVPLDEAIFKQHDENMIPLPLSQCVQFLDKNCLEEQGLYRIPGRKSRVNFLKAMFDTGKRVEFEEFEDGSTVASLLLSFLREIPGSIFTQYGVTQLRAIRTSDPDHLLKIHLIIESLPLCNRRCLHVLMQHLHRVEQNHSLNLMNSENLAMCIFPSLHIPTVAALLISKWQDMFNNVDVTQPRQSQAELFVPLSFSNTRSRNGQIASNQALRLALSEGIAEHDFRLSNPTKDIAPLQKKPSPKVLENTNDSNSNTSTTIDEGSAKRPRRSRSGGLVEVTNPSSPTPPVDPADVPPPSSPVPPDDEFAASGDNPSFPASPYDTGLGSSRSSMLS
eukprot:c2883_g1_i1.p1 GENE.c2883_g1_i1~~c2883_g1_i1.p1  ORF type:complete len:397 (+),score=62.70 c2883_g1_i1:145-1191(+)